MKKLLFLMFLLPVLVTAQSVEFDNIWLEFDVVQGGKTGINIHTKFSVYGLKNVDCKEVVFFHHEDGAVVKDRNDSYCTTNGQVAVSSNFTPTYENSIFNDFVVFMPVDEIHLLPGKHSYKCYASIYVKPQRKYIKDSDWANFTGTGTEEVEIVFPEKKTFYYTGSDGTQLSISFRTNKKLNVKQAQVFVNYRRTDFYHWEYNTSDGLGFNGYDYNFVQNIIGYDYFGNPIKVPTGEIDPVCNDKHFVLKADYSSLVLNGERFKKVTPAPNTNMGGGGYYNPGNSSSGSSGSSGSSVQTCPECHGTGQCTLCKGLGYTYNSYAGHNDECPRCFGKGRCYMCLGSGHL